MKQLNDAEKRCLEKIRAIHAGEGWDSSTPCAPDLLRTLESLGLIEQASQLRAPLEWVHLQYRLTAAGEGALRG